jgi:hypothetical protein
LKWASSSDTLAAVEQQLHLDLQEPHMSDLNAPHGIWRWLLIAATALAFAGCDNDPVERELVGTWQAAVASAAGAVQLRFTTLSNGQYRVDQVGSGALPPETGYFTAAGGEWRKENIAGGVERGTYEFLSDDSVLFQSAAAGAVVWTRVADTMATPAGPNAAPPLTAAPLPPPAAGSASTSVAATRDVLSEGPFGPPLAPSAAGSAQPNGMPFGGPANGEPAGFGVPTGTAAPFGATATTTLSAPTAADTPLFAPPPEIVAAPSAAPGATPSSGAIPAQAAQNAVAAGSRAITTLDTGALADLPRQTVNDLEGSAREAATDVVDEAAAEAERKVGERIRNFFRRDKQRGEE